MSIKTKKELVTVVEGDGRNWRGIGIAFLVILVICGIIAIAVFLLSPEIINLKKRTKKDEIDLNDIITGAFYPRLFNGSWLTADQLIYKDEQDNLVIWNINQNISSRKIFVPATLFHIHTIVDFSLSADRKYLLVKQEPQKIFRHTFIAKFKIYRIKDEELFPLTPSIKLPDARLQYAAWGPKENELIFVFQNNIFYRSSVDSPSIQLTVDGSPSIIYNGIPDWLYEEEVLSNDNAIYWSPSGSSLVYIRFDDSPVDMVGLTFYTEFLPRIEGLRYPRVGRRNPIINIYLVLFKNGGDKIDRIELRPPNSLVQSDYYITDITWVNETSVSLTWANRSQDYSELTLCSQTNEWRCESILSVNSKGLGWTELKSPVWDESGQNYFLILPLIDSEHGSYHHVAKYNVNSQNATFLTRGRFEVTNIYKYSQNLLFYEATLPGKQGERHLFELQVETGKIHCLTCEGNRLERKRRREMDGKDPNGLTKKERNEDCLFSRAFFNDDASAYVITCLGPGVPRTELRLTETNELVTILQANDGLRKKVDDLLMPKVKLLSVPIEGGFNASVRLLLPPGLREDEITKYPMLINVYGGPGSQQVTSRFDIGWGHYLATRRRIIYGVIDGRGSGNNGVDLLYQVYRRLGTVEIDDQIAVTRYLVNNLPFIDAKKVAIWGWSYGGYATTMALASEHSTPNLPEPVFSCGVAVAPVTSWYYYDSSYTERFMGIPTENDNLVGYQNSDLLHKIENLRGKNFLLVHGTADDNVHLQQSMLLMRALQRNSILFHSMIYPDQNHELFQVHSHLYRTIESFLGECFDLGTVYEEVGLRRRRIIKKEYS